MRFHEWKFCILIRILLKFISEGPIDNKSALIQVMAWCRRGDKPLPEPVQTQFTDTYCGTRGRWVKVEYGFPTSFAVCESRKIFNNKVSLQPHVI